MLLFATLNYLIKQNIKVNALNARKQILIIPKKKFSDNRILKCCNDTQNCFIVHKIKFSQLS